MSQAIDVVIPTLNRAQLLVPLLDSIRRHTARRSYRVLFVVDEADKQTQEVLTTQLCGTDVKMMVHDGTAPVKWNAAVPHCEAEWLLLCGDDVLFRPRWLEEAQPAMARVSVVGTNDLTPRTARKDHATAQLVKRSYIDDPGAAWREPGHVMHPGYHHNFADDELIRLAEYRGEWEFVESSIIEHRHYVWGTAPKDQTYERGALNGFDEDKMLFRRRRRAWMRASR